MNNKRREFLRQASDMLKEAQAVVERAAEEEQDCYDNLPEALQESDKGDKMSDAIDNLESAVESIESAVECISEAMT